MRGRSLASDESTATDLPRNQADEGSPLTHRQQQGAAVVISVCLAVMLIDFGARLIRRERRVEIDHAINSREIELAIDLNEATWPELTLLPEVSETMARRIVEFRELKGRFESLDELKQVRGIGPRTFEQVRPYLESIP